MDVRLKNTINKLNVNGILKSFKTPSFVFDLKILKENYHIFKSSLDNGKCSIRYAVKANNEVSVLKTLMNLGSGFDMASDGELSLLKKLGVHPQKIFFSSAVKIPSHIESAYQYGIRHFAFDSYSELDKIARFAPKSSVYLRIHVSNNGSIWKLDHKFGASKKDWLKLFQKAKDLGLVPEGITFHVGWNNHNLDTWKNTLVTVSRLIGSLKKIGIKISFVNLGGGFPAHKIDQIKSFSLILSIINPILKEMIEDHNVKIYAEPGTFLVANCGFLLTKIYSKIKRGSTYWLFVDSSMTNGFYWILSGLSYEISAVNNKLNSSNKILYNVTGPTCDSYDTFAKKIKLPKYLEVGDLLIVSPGGAYISAAKEYNSFPYPKTEFIK